MTNDSQTCTMHARRAHSALHFVRYGHELIVHVNLLACCYFHVLSYLLNYLTVCKNVRFFKTIYRKFMTWIKRGSTRAWIQWKSNWLPMIIDGFWRVFKINIAYLLVLSFMKAPLPRFFSRSPNSWLQFHQYFFGIFADSQKNWKNYSIPFLSTFFFKSCKLIFGALPEH